MSDQDQGTGDGEHEFFLLRDGETVRVSEAEFRAETTKNRKTKLTISAAIREAVSSTAFDVILLASGLSQNKVDGKPIYYSPELLARDYAVFEGVPVRAIKLGDEMAHTPDGINKAILSGNIIGALEGVHVENDNLVARLVIHEGADFYAGLLKLSLDRVAAGGAALVGLSIDALTSGFETTIHEGQEVSAVQSLTGPATVDVVSSPAAGGEILRLAASLQKENQMPEDTKNPQAGDKPAVLSKEELQKIKESAVEEALKALKEEQRVAEEAKEAIREKIREATKLLETKLAESNLSEKAQTVVREQFVNSTFEESALDKAIGQVRDLLKDEDPSGEVRLPEMVVGTEPRERCEAALYDMFMRNSFDETRLKARKALVESGAKPIASLHRFTREAFGIDLGDAAFGSAEKRKKLVESLTTASWTDIFGDTMNKVLIDAFHVNPWTSWRKIVRVQPRKDFSTIHAMRMGGYKNLDAVAEGANYPAMDSPGDEEHEWTPATYGGTEDLTRRMILADDVGAISRIPTAMAYAAARTLYEFVYDQLTIAGQPTMDYDATTLFETSRAYNDNLGTTALATAEVQVVRLAMQKFTDMSSAKRESVEPRYLLVPPDLEATAFGIVKPLSMYAPGETTDQAFVRTFNLEVITVRHWTNAKDHVYVADPAIFPGYQMGFIGGREEPEMFIQDNATVGSLFDRDAITYKIRHEYGGSPIDHRAFYAEDVA